MATPLMKLPRTIHKEGFNRITVDFDINGKITVKIESGKESKLPVTRKHLDQVGRAIKASQKLYEKALRIESGKAARKLKQIEAKKAESLTKGSK